MTITVKANGQLHYKTYQKELNLYLYIPPNSAHPPGQLRSLVFGRLQTYWYQNTDREDFITIAALFGEPLLNRGYTCQDITPLFEEVITKLENRDEQQVVVQPDTPPEKRPIFFHLPFHPRDI